MDAQRAIQGVRNIGRSVAAVIGVDKLHAARRGTHHVDRLGVDDGRGNSHANEQRKPNQHESCEQRGVA